MLGDLGVAAIRADGMSPSCAYCHVGQHVASAGDVPDPARLAHLYLCRGRSASAIGAITGLDRQRVTRMLRRAAVALRHPGRRTSFLRRWRAGLKPAWKPSPQASTHPRTAPAFRTVATPAAVAGEG
ncbi:MAG TPA: hypothetical protein VMA97_04160 [Streptosporangiaceae bacterium]|nr:hypothetical protein [Streptosporangiaceae bacterium]